MGQNLLPSYVLNCLNQQPVSKTIHPSLNVHALENTVNIFILVKNIGTAVIPKHKVHKFTCSNETLYALDINVEQGVNVILIAAAINAHTIYKTKTNHLYQVSLSSGSKVVF